MRYGVVATAVALAAAFQQVPVFRTGTNRVQVDAIVTSAEGGPILDLTVDDFELSDDGKPMPIADVRLVNAKATLRGPFAPIRTADDEAREAAAEGVRVFAILLDDYHVRRQAEHRVVPALHAFVDSLPATDLVGVFGLYDSIEDAHLNRDRAAAFKTIDAFYGRRGEYFPTKYPVEEEHLKKPLQIEAIRAGVTRGAFEALAVHLGGLKEGRKTLVFVSEGFRMEEFDIRELTDAANRANVAVYPLDPTGLEAPFSRGALQSPIDIFRRMALETGGTAIVQTNNYRAALERVDLDSSSYYLLAYESPHPNDGKFHTISVKLRKRRSGAQVRARAGYRAFKDQDTLTAPAPAAPPAPAVNAAFAKLADALRPNAAEPAERRHLGEAPAVAPALDIIGTPELSTARGAGPGDKTDRREFPRTGVLVIRAPLAGTPLVTARLLGRSGAALTDLPVTAGDGFCEVRLPLPGLGAADYVVELTAAAGAETRRQLVAFRVIR